MQNRQECIDAGSDYCPCYLAETGDCITCSQLQGKHFCDCNWRGICIYQEYVWSNNKTKNKREEILIEVIEKSMFTDNVLFLKIKLSDTLMRDLNEPGAYVFLRTKNASSYFDVPMSIAYVDETNKTADFYIQIIGSKTKALLEIEDELLLRGPYWNGILGLRSIKTLKDKKCIIIARGIAQAPSILLAKKLVKNNNTVFYILDKGKINVDIIDKYHEIIPGEVIKMDIFSKEFEDTFSKLIQDEDVEFIASEGSDAQHNKIAGLINSFEKNILFSASNNSSICCGEGICGSCNVRLGDGVKVKACKTQLDIEKLLERRIFNV